MSMLSAADAARAIYIDFECLVRTPPARPHPALLGVAIGADDDGVEQIITDERLAPARVARKASTRVLGAADAVSAIVSMARTSGRRVVGWSNFDRDRMIDASPDLEGDIRSIYANALKVARPWRHMVFPTVVIEREDEHAPKHTLDKYAILADYPRASRLANNQPAQWIRHTLRQLEATGGRYRQTTRQTKRDWHRLLDYNRHDVLVLRHIVVRATQELEAWRAYERTRFCVDEGRRRICFMAGSNNWRLDALLERHSASDWAFITAWNPGLQVLVRSENDRRQGELRRLIESGGWQALPGEGIGADPAWEPEESLLILGIRRDAAVRVGAQFGQLAIVVGHRGRASSLVPCRRAPRL